MKGSSTPPTTAASIPRCSSGSGVREWGSAARWAWWGDGSDNAMVESFFATLEGELLARQSFPTQTAARTALFEGIEVFYNRQRHHSALGSLSPETYERRWAAQTPVVASCIAVHETGGTSDVRYHRSRDSQAQMALHRSTISLFACHAGDRGSGNEDRYSHDWATKIPLPFVFLTSGQKGRSRQACPPSGDISSDEDFYWLVGYADLRQHRTPARNRYGLIPHDEDDVDYELKNASLTPTGENDLSTHCFSFPVRRFSKLQSSLRRTLTAT
jgi:hypothetical protein